MRTPKGSLIVSLVVNLALLLLLNVVPGWQALPFLTEQAALVVPYVSFSLAAAAVGAGLQLLAPTAWMRGLTGAIGSAFALIASVALWQVFPFDVPDPWPVILRILIGLGIFGAIVGMISGGVGFARGLLTQRKGNGDSRYGSRSPGQDASQPS